MSIKRQIIVGDFIDSYIYNDMFLLHTGDNLFVCLNPLDSIVDYIEYEKLLINQRARIFEMNQFMTDFDIHQNRLFYCNSDGVFKLNLSEFDRELNKYAVNKIWDAHVQCIRIGEKGRVAMSASQDGLFEFDTDEMIGAIDIEREVDRNIHQITPKHSLSCRWSYGNIWNTSATGDNSLFEYLSIQESSEKPHIQFKGEHTEAEIFDNKEALVFLAEKTKNIYRFKTGQLSKVKYRQSKKKDIQFDSETLVYSMDQFEDPIIKFSCVAVPADKEKINIYIFETSTRIFAVRENRGVIYSSDQGEIIVGWRVFQRSKNYLNQLHIIFEDRMEIITFN